MVVLAKQASDDLTKANQNGQPFDKAKYSSGKNDNLAGEVLMSLGGVAVVAGIVVGALGLRESKAARVAFAPWINGQGAGLAFEVRQ